MPVVGEDAHHGQVVPLAHLEVVGIVGGGDLHHAGALFHVGVLVAHDGDLLVQQGQDHVAAVEMGVAGIFRIHRHGSIAQHGFRPGGGQLQHLPGLLYRVEQVIELALLLLVLHLGVGDGGIAAGAPVHHPVAPVDEALLVQPHEHLHHRPVEPLVHGEALPGPVAAGAQLLLLFYDAPAVFLPPLPGPLQEALPAQILLGQPLLAQGVDDLHLGGDGGVVGARQPQGGVALHAVIAGEHVLGHGVHGVAHVKLAGDVGRGHHDDEGLFARHPVGGEIALVHPVRIQPPLHLLGLEHLLHFPLLLLHV